ncbi:Floral homeotic protein GLOBOSA [Cinnamomum micranthum f. kanehirae]|uniref:Floral homeotic protein GLOBOSA n=1 Tax=Cinnamomum micranthum f. kanehirae TaxID=337451 RepID=A0A443PYQ2_9MAGN|nr:Floral homeotic protein GLOBOSA [Cinnamomum micranthum f. kanehirae]
MGRMKIKIRRLETASARQITYSKRKAGLAKKAMELSVLCDINVALVMFSPAGKPTSYIGGNNYWTNPDEVETYPETVVMEECLVESLNRLQKRKTQNCAWPPGQYFPRLNGRSQVDQKLVMNLRDFSGHGNARGAAENVKTPFFNHARLLNSMGPSYEAHPENHI